jgi:hypothetical protein
MLDTTSSKSGRRQLHVDRRLPNTRLTGLPQGLVDATTVTVDRGGNNSWFDGSLSTLQPFAAR